MTLKDDSVSDDSEPNSYMLLSMGDVALVIENLTKDSDQLKLFFSCKALKNIFLVSDPTTTEKILSRFGKQFLKRLVKILTYDHL